MLAGISAVFGLELDRAQMESIVKEVAGGGGVEQAGRAAAKQLAKYVPGVNFVNTAVAAAVTGALGEAYIRLCSEMLRRQAAGKPMPNADTLGYLMSAYKGLLNRPGPEPQPA
jgi:uncharacterized protein (DUF697 family)